MFVITWMMVKSSDRNIRYYPYQVLSNIASHMDVMRSISDLPSKYKNELEDRDLEY